MGKKIISDTDIGPDYDDAAALALLHNLAQQKDIQILGVTNCTINYSGAVTISPLDGITLVKQHADRMYSMAGNFAHLQKAEYNIACETTFVAGC